MINLTEKFTTLENQGKIINELQNKVIKIEELCEASTDIPEQLTSLMIAFWTLSSSCKDSNLASSRIKHFISLLFKKTLDTSKLDQLMSSIGFTKQDRSSQS